MRKIEEDYIKQDTNVIEIMLVVLAIMLIKYYGD
jgi:hypothetical protein